MAFDFTPYFEKYEELVAKADDAFEHVKQAYAECVNCEEKCADCCFALFDFINEVRHTLFRTEMIIHIDKRNTLRLVFLP